MGESMQIWRFSTEASNALADELHKYKKELNGKPDLRTNLYPINRVIQKYSMQCIDSQNLPWININSLGDIKKAATIILFRNNLFISHCLNKC